MPSSAAITCGLIPSTCCTRSRIAIAQGSWTRRPSVLWTMMRQLPDSSRLRSRTRVSSVGRTPVAQHCSRSSATRLSRAWASSPASMSRRRSTCSASDSPVLPGSSNPACASRRKAPLASPVAAGRPRPSPRQNGRRALRPSAGSTTTRSPVICRIRQLDVPSVMMSPGLDSLTISSSSSPTRRRPASSAPSGSTTGNMPRSGIVPDDVTASRCAFGRALSRPVARSHTILGEKSDRSAEEKPPDSSVSTDSKARRGSEA